jgi:hypothetical protein
MPDRSAAPADDPRLTRSRELDEARASIARLQVENAALRTRLGAAFPQDPPALALHPSPVARLAPATVYRAEAAFLHLDRELDEANLQLVNLGINNAILRARAESIVVPRPRSIRAATIALAVAAGAGFLWLITGSVLILLPALILLLMCWGVLRLIDTIKPTDSGTRPPPPWPPSGGR